MDRLADGSRGIALLQTMARDQPHHRVAVERTREVVILDVEDSCARIENAWQVAGAGQLHERVMLPERERSSVRRLTRQLGAWRITREGESGLDLAVLGKGLGARQEDPTPAGVEGVTALPRLAQ